MTTSTLINPAGIADAVLAGRALRARAAGASDERTPQWADPEVRHARALGFFLMGGAARAGARAA